MIILIRNTVRIQQEATEQVSQVEGTNHTYNGEVRYEVAVVGGGAAGTSAAVFTARGGLRTVLVDDGQSGVQRAMLYNHIPYADGISGPDFYRLSLQQAAKAGAAVEQGKVVSLNRQGQDDGGWVLQLEDGRRLEAQAVILCTGKVLDLAKALGLELVAGRERRYPEVIKVDSDGRTSLPGVWAAGAVAGVTPHTITVAGDGARVAINLVSEKKGQRWVDHDVLPAMAHS